MNYSLRRSVGVFGSGLAMVMSLSLFPAAPAMAESADTTSLETAVNGAHRGDSERQRDQYRRPLETLSFLGIKPSMTVVELWPGRGWYTQILAPYLRDSGELRAASFGENAGVGYRVRIHKGFMQMLSENPGVYDQVAVNTLNPPVAIDMGPPESADAVLTFRNLHNWMKDGVFEDVVKASFEVLKPGGVFGVVEHRARPESASAEDPESGYVLQQEAISRIEAAGFRLVESSELNANPLDTTEHPEGVWTLPPSLRLGDVDRDKYLAIGESDRMTLRFEKP